MRLFKRQTLKTTVHLPQPRPAKPVLAAVKPVTAVPKDESDSKNALLADYVVRRMAERSTSTEAPFVQEFIRSMPRMPAYATNLAAKLLDEHMAVHEVVQDVKSDPSIVAAVLKTVNSAQYSFHNKIESFYHACMI